MATMCSSLHPAAARGATGPVVVAWQGGEPTLMGLAFFRRSIDLVAKYQKPGQKIMHTIQTNGMLLNDEWARFFKAHVSWSA